MKWFGFVLVGMMLGIGSVCLSAEAVPDSPRQSFNYKRYVAQSGELYNSSKSDSYYDDHVNTIFVDSSNRVWVGTASGLAVYDGKEWVSRTFAVSGMNIFVRTALRLLGISNCGPDEIAEGPTGTVWLCGSCGLWRFHDGQYEKIESAPRGLYSGMAIDKQGAVWIATRENVQKYDGKTWTTVLCPYIGKPKSSEAAGLIGIVVDSNGSIWVGGTVYGKPNQPWEHDGPIWVVDQKRKKRNDGPPMAPLFEFNRVLWRAFGTTHGLEIRQVFPELNQQGQIVARTSRGYFLREGDTWKPANNIDAFPNKRWILREREQGRSSSGSELLFRDIEHLVEVQPKEVETGEVLDLQSARWLSLELAEDLTRNCIWLGTWHGLYRIWQVEE